MKEEKTEDQTLDVEFVSNAELHFQLKSQEKYLSKIIAMNFFCTNLLIVLTYYFK